MQRHPIVLIFLSILMTLPLNPGFAQEKEGSEEPIEVNWLTWEEAVKANQKEPKKVFIDVYTHWCGWCKKMDKTTFQDPEIVSMLNEDFHPVKMNAEMKRDIIMGKDTLEFKKHGRRGTHELALKLMRGKASYPTVVFLDENLQLITPIPGYRKANTMEPILVFFQENRYKETKNLNKFIKQYNNKGDKKEKQKDAKNPNEQKKQK